MEGVLYLFKHFERMLLVNIVLVVIFLVFSHTQWLNLTGFLREAVTYEELSYGWTPFWQTFSAKLDPTRQVATSIFDMSFLLFLATVVLNLAVIWKIGAKEESKTQ